MKHLHLYHLRLARLWWEQRADWHDTVVAKNLHGEWPGLDVSD